ncbi:hypothetical protein [Methanoplanus limicola]
MINPKVESTNNKAERAVRPMTVKGKFPEERDHQKVLGH